MASNVSVASISALGVVFVGGLGYFAFKPNTNPRLIMQGTVEMQVPNDGGVVYGTFEGVMSDAIKVSGDSGSTVTMPDAAPLSIDATPIHDSGPVFNDAAVAPPAPDAAVSVNDGGVVVVPSTGWPAKQLGMNIGFITDWAYGKEFADVVMHSRPWGTVAAPYDEKAVIDASGWPTGDAGVYLWADLPGMGGSYKLRFSCNSNTPSVTFGGAGGGVANLACAAGVCNADVNATNNGVSSGWLVFTNTSGGVRNVKLMRPGHAFTDLYNKAFLGAIAGFSPIRTMDFAATNSNQVVKWSDRTLPTYATQARKFGGQSAGAAWEYIIELANITNHDIWINVPHKADDAYITALATLVRDRLHSNLHAYVEWSNEPWNTAPAFSQGNDNHSAAIADVTAGVAPKLNYDGNTNDWEWAARRVARNAARVSTLFRAAFGAGYAQRVCVFLNTQRGWDMWIMQGLTYLEATHSGPVSNYICGAGGSTYVSTQGNPISIDAVYSNIDWGSYSDELATDVAWTRSYGLRRIAYEGGPSFDHSGTGDQFRDAANLDGRIGSVVAESARRFWLSGGDVYVYYQLSGPANNVWATYQDYGAPTARSAALMVEMGKLRPTPNIGAAIPNTVTAGSYSARNNYESPSQMGSGLFYVYLFSAAQAGAYTVSAALDVSTPGQVQLVVDGSTLGTETLGSGSTKTQGYVANLAAGVHAVRVKAMSGKFNLKSVSVQ